MPAAWSWASKMADSVLGNHMPLRHSLSRWLILALLCAASLQGHAAALGVGAVPPDRLGETLGGKAVTLSSYPGRAVVVTFWASWCQYCLKELPVLENIQRKVGKDRLQVIAVNGEDFDTFRKLARIMKPFEIQVISDSGKEVHDAYGVSGIPHMVIIGRDGKIQQVYRGYAESELPAIVADLNKAIGAIPQP